MKLKEIMKVIVSHLLVFSFGSLLFIFMFRSSMLVHLVMFYRGIFLIIVSGIITFVITIIFRLRYKATCYTFRDAIISTLLIICMNIMFFTHVPITADRSLSIFLLSQMNNQDTLLSKDDLRSILITKYIEENDAVGKRIEEQLVSKNIEYNDGGYEISVRGRSLIKIYSYVARLFNINDTNITN